MIKLIIFDCYGAVLSKGYPDTVAVLSKRFKIPEKRIFDVMYTKYFNMAAERKISQKEAWEKAIEALGLPITRKELLEIHFGLLKIKKPVFEIAKQLRKNYTTLLLSKNTRSQFAETKKRFPVIWKNFDSVINTWELGLPKASRKTVQEICRRFKVRPAEIVFIDDQMNNLIEPKKMGVKTIFYKNFSQFKKELKNYLN